MFRLLPPILLLPTAEYAVIYIYQDKFIYTSSIYNIYYILLIFRYLISLCLVSRFPKTPAGSMGNTVRCLFIALVLQSYMAPQIIAVENELCCFLTIADSSGDATPPPNVSVFPMFPCFPCFRVSHVSVFPGLPVWKHGKHGRATRSAVFHYA